MKKVEDVTRSRQKIYDEIREAVKGGERCVRKRGRQAFKNSGFRKNKRITSEGTEG